MASARARIVGDFVKKTAKSGEKRQEEMRDEAGEQLAVEPVAVVGKDAAKEKVMTPIHFLFPCLTMPQFFHYRHRHISVPQFGPGPASALPASALHRSLIIRGERYIT